MVIACYKIKAHNAWGTFNGGTGKVLKEVMFESQRTWQWPIDQH
jgi:hypothetical protein